MTAASGAAPDPAPDEDAVFEALLEDVYRLRGFDLRGYKRTSLTRRVHRRVAALRLDGLAAYRHHVAADPDELGLLLDTLLINVTSFRRDPDTWNALAERVLPDVIGHKAHDGPIRAWSAGCATGEEAFTLAMLLCEALGEEQFGARVKIYATDVDDAALAAGRAARYPLPAVSKTLPDELREHYFTVEDDHATVRPWLRRKVIFGHHDLVQDPPISRIDILACRNTLMYLTAPTQTRVLENLRFAIRDGGYLVVGRSEALASRTKLFTPFDLKRRVFVPAPGPEQRRTGRSAVGARAGGRGLRDSSTMSIRDVGFEVGAVAQLLIDGEGRLAAANRSARALFGLGPPDIGRPLQDLEVSYRPLEVRSKIEQANAERRPVSVREVEWTVAGERRLFDVDIAPLVEPTGAQAGVSASFTDVTRHRLLQEELDRSRNELETAYEELQSAVEELETTNEELQSTNEELETTNEELQSTNEELETMNEELQSTNEQLTSINDELRKRTDELDDANAFLEAILSGLQSAVVVLDPAMTIRVWNKHAEELWGLRNDEVQGAHLMNLDIGLPVERLRQPIRACLAGEVTDGEEVLDAVNRRGRAVRCRIRLAPLRRLSGALIGVILLMDVLRPGEAGGEQDSGPGSETEGGGGAETEGGGKARPRPRAGGVTHAAGDGGRRSAS
ncbi:MAG TPA: CheR family methyltransferase [Acidimicrobiales bacterium]|nr:CheR family methyltransferase [Acidimicrobiales bacterium]